MLHCCKLLWNNQPEIKNIIELKLQINPAHKTVLKKLLLIIFIVVCGLSTKFYSGPFADWVNDSAGGVFYVVFWCLLINLLRRGLSPGGITITVLLITSLLEFLQLWHPPFLEWIRSSFTGRTLIGTTFNPTDFIYYIIGSLLGYWILRIQAVKNGEISS